MPSGENQPTLQAVRTVFFDLEDPREPLTATDVADAIGCSRRTAFNKLTALVERGDLRTKKTGASGRVFWRPRQTAASQTAPGDDLDSRLTSEQMRELEFRSDALGQPLVDAADGDVTVTVDSVVPLPDGTYLEYWDATGISAEKLLAMQDHFPSNLGGRLLILVAISS